MHPVVVVDPLVVVVEPLVDVEEDVLVTDPAREAGIHPPFTHTPPPIELNGSEVVQPTDDVVVLLLVDEVVGGGGGGVVVVDPPLMPDGTHPPLTQVPPPIDANGSGVVQPVVDPDVLDDVVVVVVDVDDDVFSIDAGIHPPFTQTPPPIAANGSDVVQPPLEEVEDDVDVDPAVLAVALPTSNRPLLIHASYVDWEPTVRAQTSSE